MSKPLVQFAERTTIHGLRDLILSLAYKKNSRFLWCFIFITCIVVLVWSTSTEVVYYLEKPVAYSVSLKTRARLPQLYFTPQGVIATKKMIQHFDLTEDTLVYLAGFVRFSKLNPLQYTPSPTFNYSKEEQKVTAILTAENMTLPQLLKNLTGSIFERGGISKSTLATLDVGWGSIWAYKMHIELDHNDSESFVWTRRFEEHLPGTLKHIYTHGIIGYGDDNESPLRVKEYVTFQYGWITRFTFDQVVAPGWSRTDCETSSEQQQMYAAEYAECMSEIKQIQNCSCLPIQLVDHEQQFFRPLSSYCNNRDGKTFFTDKYIYRSCLDDLSNMCNDRFYEIHETRPPCTTTTYTVSSAATTMLHAYGGEGWNVSNRGTDLFFSLSAHRRATVMEEQPLNSIEKLLARIGGVLSLLFGASLISIAQLLYFMLKHLAGYIRARDDGSLTTDHQPMETAGAKARPDKLPATNGVTKRVPYV